jgi:N-acetylated-alpha-linked acidic dipeptidase
VFDVWGKYFTTPGGGDAIWFQGGACVSTMDFGFIPAVDDNPFFYHSGFDTVEWMERFGDPGWHYHVATAKLWALMTARLTEPSVLRMDASDYSVALRGWLDGFRLDNSWSRFNLTVLYNAVDRFSHAAKKFDAYAASLAIYKRPWWKLWYLDGLKAAIKAVNQRYMAVERAFD